MLDKTQLNSFQFLGIPPKGERFSTCLREQTTELSFQFLGIPPKGELQGVEQVDDGRRPVSNF